MPTTFVVIVAPSASAGPPFLTQYDGDPFSEGNRAGEQFGISGLKIESTVPPQPTPRIPDNVPDNVAAPLLEGLQAQASGMLPSAVYNMRKALERAVRQQDPNGSGMLKSRIKQLAEQQKIPPTLVDLAHTVRAEGNVEVHEEEAWTGEQVQELVEFTILLLTYVYTLPKRLAAIADHRGKAPGDR